MSALAWYHTKVVPTWSWLTTSHHREQHPSQLPGCFHFCKWHSGHLSRSLLCLWSSIQCSGALPIPQSSSYLTEMWFTTWCRGTDKSIWEDTVIDILTFSFQIIPEDAAMSSVCNMAMPQSTWTRNKLRWKGAFIWGSRALLHPQLLHAAVSSQQSQFLSCPNMDNSTAWQHKPQTQNSCYNRSLFLTYCVCTALSTLPLPEATRLGQGALQQWKQAITSRNRWMATAYHCSGSHFHWLGMLFNVM